MQRPTATQTTTDALIQVYYVTSSTCSCLGALGRPQQHPRLTAPALVPHHLAGARGGRAEFSWDNVKSDKDREFYLGHSVKASVGRWQKGALLGAPGALELLLHWGRGQYVHALMQQPWCLSSSSSSC